MGSKSKSHQNVSTTNQHWLTNNTTTHNTTNVHDNRSFTSVDDRDFLDQRVTNVADHSVDRRAVLQDAMQIVDSTIVSVDPSDHALVATVNSWERSARALLENQQFDVRAAQELVSEMLSFAERGTVAMTSAQVDTLREWRGALDELTDFASQSLQVGADLISEAGDRQRSVTDRILDLAAGAVGQTTQEQVRVIFVSLIGVAAIIFATGKLSK